MMRLIYLFMLFTFPLSTALGDFDNELELQTQNLKIEAKEGELRELERKQQVLNKEMSRRRRAVSRAQSELLKVRQGLGYKKLNDDSLQTEMERAALNAAVEKLENERKEVAASLEEKKDLTNQIKAAKRDLNRYRRELAKMQPERAEAIEEGCEDDGECVGSPK